MTRTAQLTRLVAAMVAAIVIGTSVGSGATKAAPDDGPPVPLIDGARQVSLRNGSGGLATYTTIPGGSAFRSHGGGDGAQCNGKDFGDDPATVDVVEEFQPIRSTRWVFVEGLSVATFESPPPPNPADLMWEWYIPDVALQGVPLDQVTRTFSVFCNDQMIGANFLGIIQVAATDPMFDPRTRLTALYNGLQLAPLALVTPPQVSAWGGVVVQMPTWLAIQPSGWRTARSQVERWRGWTLALYAQPRTLDFEVSFVPDGGAATSTVVPCLATSDPRPERTGAVPPRPADLADFIDSSSQGTCWWAPPAAGTVTITARVVFGVTFRVSIGSSVATTTQPDYVWRSAPQTFRAGELRTVNVLPTG